MMHLLSLGLVLTSLVAGSIWSPPSPPPHHDHREVIVKEGHRVVVVEYDKEADGSTKVLISPQDASGVDVEQASNAGEGHSGPRELVCDAFGKCKYKIASALGRTKDKISKKAHEFSDMEEHAKQAAGGAAGKAKTAVNEAVEKAKQTGQGLLSGEPPQPAGGTIGESLSKAKKVAGDVKDTVKDAAVKTAHFDVVDSPKRIREDIERNVTGKVEGAEHVMGQDKETVENAGQKSLGEILSKLKEVTYEVVWYMVSPEKMNAVVGLIHMLGFSTAYGMCIWVTFVSSYILGRHLPRTQFGMVQSRIYPVYFRAMAYCVGAAVLGHLVSQRKVMFSKTMELFQGLSLLSALLMILMNMIGLEPRATKLMFERMKIEKEEGRGVSGAVKHGVADHGGDTVARPAASEVAERQDVLRMNEKLKKLNTYSSALNVSTLVLLTWHMAYMGQRLQAVR